MNLANKKKTKRSSGSFTVVPSPSKTPPIAGARRSASSIKWLNHFNNHFIASRMRVLVQLILKRNLRRSSTWTLFPNFFRSSQWRINSHSFILPLSIQQLILVVHIIAAIIIQQIVDRFNEASFLQQMGQTFRFTSKQVDLWHQQIKDQRSRSQEKIGTHWFYNEITKIFMYLIRFLFRNALYKQRQEIN